MDRNDVDWRGYWSAVVTPFTEDGDLDMAGLAAVIRRTIDDGASGILVNGSTGEWFSQSTEERHEVARVAVEAAEGRAPIIVGVTSGTARAAGELARHAEEVGAAGVMTAPPPASRPTHRELIAFYREVYGAVSIPAWLYNFPQEGGHALSLDQIGELIEIDNIVAIKQSGPTIGELLETIERYGDRVRVFGSLLSRLGVALMTSGYGGDGHFGSGMLFGRDMSRFFEHVWRGETQAAVEIADRIAVAMTDLLGPRADGYNWAFGGMQPTLKAAMNLLGQPAGYPRKPKLPVESVEDLEQISAILRRAGLEPARSRVEVA